MSDSKTFLSQLDWRFATKKFDPSKTVSEADLAKILEAIQKAPTSLGIQAYHVYVVVDKAIREKMTPVSYGQPQIENASAVLVFCARTDVKDRIDHTVELLSGGSEEGKAAIKEYSDMMYKAESSRTPEQLESWTARQTYIALGFALAACAELGIDSCPMEGFDPVGLSVVLEIPSNMKPYAYLTVGYRAEDPARPKFRFGQDNLFTKI